MALSDNSEKFVGIRKNPERFFLGATFFSRLFHLAPRRLGPLLNESHLARPWRAFFCLGFKQRLCCNYSANQAFVIAN